MARRPRKTPAQADGRAHDADRAVYIISVAAELAGVHPQTLRIYERKGLLHPFRTPGNSRRYSERDIQRLRLIQALTQEQGINLAGVKRVVDMAEQIELLREQSEALQRQLATSKRQLAHELDRLRGDAARAEMVPRAEATRVRLRVQPSAAARRRRLGPIALGPPAGRAGD